MAAGIAILIAADVPRAIVAQEIREGAKNQPIAVRSALGWALLGVADGDVLAGCIPTDTHNIRVNHHKVDLQEIVQEFRTTESFGTKFDFKSSRSTHDLLTFLMGTMLLRSYGRRHIVHCQTTSVLQRNGWNTWLES